MRQRHIGHIGLTNNEISAILDPINMVKLCHVKATILVFQNKEAAAILNNIIVVK